MRTRFFDVALTTQKMVDKGLAIEAGVTQYEDVIKPKRETACSAGYDFRAAEEIEIPSIWVGVAKLMGVKLRNFGKRTLQSIDYIFRDKDIEKTGDKEDELRPFQPYLIHTGIKAFMQDNEVLKLYMRSSTPRKFGLVMAHAVGIIDSDYFGNEDNDGEICFAVYNLFPFTVTIKKNERIGQGVFTTFLKTDDDKATGERVGGMGSSDKTE